ncbi:hypothetical protein Tco_0169772 [Tanacetum coccineum]
MPPKRNGMSAAAIEQLITQRVADALLAYEANWNNGNENDNGNRSHDSGGSSGRPLHTTRGCTYKELLNCQPLNFKRTEGAIELAHWFEKMESVFHITYEMTWKSLTKMMTEAYYPRNEIQKLENEL